MLWNRGLRFLRRLGEDCRANITLTVALCAPVLLCVAGFGADYGYASYVKQTLDRGLDAAVLAATSQSSATSAGGYSNTAWLATWAQNVFVANTTKLNVPVTPTLTVVPNGTGGVVASGSYQYAVPTFFSGMIGINTIKIAGQAQSTANPPTYINYYIVVDISQSMGLASTTADQTALFNRTTSYGNGGCTFGCHTTTSGQAHTNEYLAHSVSPRITLRIDAAVTAIQNIIADAQSAAGSAQNIKIGLYTMSDDPTTGKQLNTISSPISDYTSLSTLAGTIDLGGNTASGLGDSNFTPQLTKFNTLLPLNGTGASAASPLNYVFLVTDGLTDYYNTSCSYYSHCTGVLDTSSCTTLKLKSKVGVVYTTYLPIYANNNASNGFEVNYQALVQPYASQIAPTLQSCASTNLFYQADDGPALNTAMKALFASTLKTARLTQ